MTDPDPFFEQALEEIGAFSRELYAEAAPRSGTAPADEEIAPLFRELTRIRDRYENPEIIGCGGMKEVYRTYDRRATREVALAKPAPSLGEDGFDAFLREAHITARLDHPGIVKLFDMGIDDDGRPFFTMELKKGRSLREILRDARDGGNFPLRRRLDILLRVCEAISYAHSRRVLHLDLKPDNIQVGDFGEVHVCDWGMGVVVRQAADEIRRTEVLLDPDLYGPLLIHSRGTKGYMAPEQLEAGRAKSFEMDVYALGCLLQELVLLEPPHGEAVLEEISDEALRAIVCKALHPSPEKRYRSVDAFSRDLSRYLTGYSTSVEGAGFLREVRLFYRRNRLPCHLVGGLLFLLVAFTTVFIEQLRRSREHAVDARHAAERTQTLYLTEKVNAETALQNYLAEREESDRRLREQAGLAALSVTELTNSPFILENNILQTVISNAMKHMDAAITLAPPPESPVWHQKFWLLFVTQNLEGAMSIQDKDLREVADLIPLAAEYAPKKAGDRFLPAAEFGRLLRDLAVIDDNKVALRRFMIERMLAFDQTHPRSDEDRATILREALTALNPGDKELVWEYAPKSKSLKLGGTRLSVLSIMRKGTPHRLSLLRFLNPLSLNLRGSGLTDLREITGLNLHGLDLRETRVSNLQPLGQMRSLRRLRVSPGQFEPQQLSELPTWIDVVVEK